MSEDPDRLQDVPLSAPPVGDKIERHGIVEMIGEFLREAAVLVAVFIPLEVLVKGVGFTLPGALVTVVLSVGLLAIGVTLERVRRK